MPYFVFSPYYEDLDNICEDNDFFQILEELVRNSRQLGKHDISKLTSVIVNELKKYMVFPKSKSNTIPYCLYMGGGICSGKSTVIRTLIRLAEPYETPLVLSNDVLRGIWMTKIGTSVSSPEASLVIHVLFECLAITSLKRKYNVCLDINSSDDIVEKFSSVFISNGLETKTVTIFLSTSKDIAMRRLLFKSGDYIMSTNISIISILSAKYKTSRFRNINSDYLIPEDIARLALG